MIEARGSEFAELCTGRDEVERAIDRDRLVRRLGRQARAGARLLEPGGRPVLQLHRARADRRRRGRRARRAAAARARLARRCPRSTGGNAVVAVASETHPLAAIELAEALATSDVPGGVVNLLTGHRDELAPWLASHMDVNAIDVTGADGGSRRPRAAAAADNVKRVVHGAPDAQSPGRSPSFLELKTVWHPVGQ